MASAYIPVLIDHGVLTQTLEPEDVITLTPPEGTVVVSSFIRSLLATDQPGAGIVYDNVNFVVSPNPSSTATQFRYLASSGDNVEATIVYIGVD